MSEPLALHEHVPTTADGVTYRCLACGAEGRRVSSRGLAPWIAWGVPRPKPAEVFPPSEFLRDEMVERGWTQAVLAERTGRDRSFISRVMSGAYPIGPRFALDLERAMGTSAEMWCRLQADYAVWIERQRQAKGERRDRTRLHQPD